MESIQREFLISLLNTISRLIVLGKTEDALSSLESIIAHERLLICSKENEEPSREMQRIESLITTYNLHNQRRCTLVCSIDAEDKVLKIMHAYQQVEQILFNRVAHCDKNLITLNIDANGHVSMKLSEE